MYLGSSYPKFYIYETATDTEIDFSPVSLQKCVVSRQHKTLENENAFLFINPLTKKKIKKSDGFWWQEIISVASRNFTGTVIELNDKEVTEETQSEFNKITNLIQYINNPAYYVKYVPHEDAERLLGFEPFECNITVINQESKGTITALGSDSFVMNIDILTLKIESKDIVAAPFLPQPATAPEWVAPTDGAVTGYSVDFEWTEVTGYTDYTLQISTSAGFESIYLVYNDTVSGVEETVSSLTGETYYARVRAGETGLWSDTLTFYPFSFEKCLSMNPLEANSNYIYGYANYMGQIASNTKGQFNAWVYPLSYPTRARQVIMWVTASTSSTTSHIVSLIWNAGLSGYQIQVEISSGGVPRNSYIMTTDDVITLDTWHCIGYSFDLGATGDKITIYLDGTTPASTQTTNGTPPTSTNTTQGRNFYFCNYYNLDSTYELSCYIDHIMFIPYRPTAQQYLLTDAEMKALWNGGNGRNYPSSAWEVIKFNELSNTIHATKKLYTSNAETTLGTIRSGGTIIDHS